MDDDPSTIGDRVRRAREEQGLSVPAFALACGVSDKYLRQIENNVVRAPSLALGLRIAKVLDVDPYWLATGKEDTIEGRVTRLETLVRWLQEKVAPPARGQR